MAMSRLTTTLIAAAAAALAAIAVVALPAIGDSGRKSPGVKATDESAFAACLRAHGLEGAPTTGEDLKPWLGRKEAADPQAVKAAIDACKRSVPGAGAPGPDVDQMVTCVRSHGIDAPTAPDEFKRWVAQRQKAGDAQALDDALVACKMALAPEVKPGGPGKPGVCGDDAVKPPADARAARST
jgi:hypothetical protein